MKAKLINALGIAVLIHLSFFAVVGVEEADAAFGLFDVYNFPDIEWKTIETEHWVIHYQASSKYGTTSEYTARKCAKYCEWVYEKVCGHYDYYLTEKTHIVVRDEEDIANGFASYSSDWVTIWATNLYYIMRGRMEWVPDVLTHEFAHIVSLKCNDNYFERTIYGFGLGLYEDGVNNIDVGVILPVGGGMIAPTYWVEGTAEFTTHEAGHNEWSSSRDMLLRMGAVDDALPTWDQLQNISGQSGWDRERVYNHGYNIGIYLKETYGADTYAKFAQESGKKWQWSWNKVIEKVLGITGEQMYQGWREWVEKKYELQTRDIRKELHIGDKIKLSERRKPWEEMTKQEKERDGVKLISSIGQFHPQYTPDGKYLVYKTRRSRVIMLPVTEDKLPQYSGVYLSRKEQYEIEEDAMRYGPMNWDSQYAISADGTKLAISVQGVDHWYGDPTNLIGYYPYDLFVYEFIYDEEGEIEDTELIQLSEGLRALDPTFSPDAEKIAFVQARDGRHRIGVMDYHSREIEYILEYEDDPQIQGLRWSPDGSKICFSMYRSSDHLINPEGRPPQQDIYTINPDGTDLTAITFDRAEDRDPKWSSDGKKIYFSSDRTDIFNVYEYEMETGKLTQITNVLGGAYFPFITEKGNLLYSYFHSYGFKLWYLKKEDWYNKVIEESNTIDQAKVKAFNDIVEDMPTFDARKYSLFHGGLQPPWVIPELYVVSDGVKGGFTLIWDDYAGKHTLWSALRWGEDYDVGFGYENRMWYPELYVGAYEARRASDLGQKIEMAGLLKQMESKQIFKVQFAWAGATLPISADKKIDFTYEIRNILIKTTDTGAGWEKLMDTHSLRVYFTYEGVDYYTGDADINPHAGWNLGVRYTGNDSDIADPFVFEDPSGAELTGYWANQVDVEYIRFFPMPIWPLKELPNNRVFDYFKSRKHTLEFAFTGGYIDKNVNYQDELFAGGRIPIYTFGDFSPNTQFAGYEDYSITGETLLVFSLAYRFPLWGLDGSIDKCIGPIYLDKLWFQVFGSVGNAWSYTAEHVNPETGEIMPGGKREIPFRDTSYNGNKWVSDAGVELRLKSYLFNRFYWNSFFRAAYGFQKIRGTGDLNDDGIYEDKWEDDVDPFGNVWDEEDGREWRFYLGLGAGW